MKKVIAVLLMISIIATPAYALDALSSLFYKEVKLGRETVLVNRITGKVEKRLVDGTYEAISSEQGYNGIISDQEMYQAQYEQLSSS